MGFFWEFFPGIILCIPKNLNFLQKMESQKLNAFFVIYNLKIERENLFK
jgi:hypothetical protein